MKVIVKKPIIDKYTGDHYEVGKVLDLKKERIDEILAVDPELIEVQASTRTKKK